jgi:hypothetical protein
MLKGRIAGSLFAALFPGDWPHEFLENDDTLDRRSHLKRRHRTQVKAIESLKSSFMINLGGLHQIRPASLKLT